MRIVGPNCLGVMFPGVALNASFASCQPTPGSLALISQSGAIAAAMVDWGAERAVGFSGIVSIGDHSMSMSQICSTISPWTKDPARSSSMWKLSGTHANSCQPHAPLPALNRWSW